MTMGGADAQVVSTGVDRRKGNINSPSVFNSSLNFRQFARSIKTSLTTLHL